jgi:hypothetical protein
MLPLLQTVLYTLLVLPIRENHAQGFPQVLEYEHKHKIVRKNLTNVWIEMIPDVKERVIEGGTELNLTCIVGPTLSSVPDSIVSSWRIVGPGVTSNRKGISWQLPDGILNDPAVSSLFS